MTSMMALIVGQYVIGGQGAEMCACFAAGCAATGSLQARMLMQSAKASAMLRIMPANVMSDQRINALTIKRPRIGDAKVFDEDQTQHVVDCCHVRLRLQRCSVVGVLCPFEQSICLFFHALQRPFAALDL